MMDVNDTEGIEKSCKTCQHYMGSSPYDYEGEYCQLSARDDFPPVAYLPNFPFKNGCKRYTLAWTLDEEKVEDFTKWHKEQKGNTEVK